jgi:hypothetical protein
LVGFVKSIAMIQLLYNPMGCLVVGHYPILLAREA